jgi:hypothetical protein
MIYPDQLIMPLYTWQIRDRFTYLSPQLSMLCIFLADPSQIYFFPTIKYPLYIPGIYVTDLLISTNI